MKFPNLVWAIRQRGNQFQFAAQLGKSESWISRRLTGRVEFADEDRQLIAQQLHYPVDWLFQIVMPPIDWFECSSGEGA